MMRYNEYHQLQQAGIDIEDLFTVSFADIDLMLQIMGFIQLGNFMKSIRNIAVISLTPLLKDGYMR